MAGPRESHSLPEEPAACSALGSAAFSRAGRLLTVLGVLGALVTLPGAACTVDDDGYGCPLDDRWEAWAWSPTSFSWRQLPDGEPVLGMHLWVDGVYSSGEPLYTFSAPTVSGATVLSSVMDASRLALTLQPADPTEEVVVRLPIECDGTPQLIRFSVLPGEPDPLLNHLDYDVALE